MSRVLRGVVLLFITAGWLLPNVALGSQAQDHRVYLPSVNANRYSPFVPFFIKDIRPGPQDSTDGYYYFGMASAGGRLFLNANDGRHGMELWVSNGSEMGTRMVKDIVPGVVDSHPYDFVELEDVLYFHAWDFERGLELWRSNGYTSGTYRVKDIKPGYGTSNPEYLTVSNSLLFFSADSPQVRIELWRSDGTRKGTQLVKDVWQGWVSSTPKELTDVSGTLFFVTGQSVGTRELWRSDGTEAGTYRVTDVAFDTNPDYRTTPIGDLTAVGERLFFRASQGMLGSELWSSDGTSEGTFMVKDIIPGWLSSTPHDLVEVNGKLYFLAHDGSSNSPIVWMSDGTEAGTVPVAPVSKLPFLAYPDNLTELNGKLHFTAFEDGQRYALWKTDGGQEGLERVIHLARGNCSFLAQIDVPSNEMIAANNYLFLNNCEEDTGWELWVSDGTEPGTRRLTDINPGPEDTSVRFLTPVGRLLYFMAETPEYGEELWGLLLPPG